MISIKDFYQFKKSAESFITNSAFSNRLLFEAIEDEEFAKEISSYITKLSNTDVSSEELEAIFEALRLRTEEYYKLAKKSSNFNQKLDNALRSLAFFYFIESIDEHSVYSESIIEKIKEKFPKDYLQIVSDLDKLFLSEDTKGKIEPIEETRTINDDFLKQYIVLKKWQDKQHSYYAGEYDKFLTELHSEFLGDKDKTLSGFDLEHKSLRKRLFDRLREKKIIDLDNVSLLAGIFKKFTVEFVGGKMYGLAVLNSKGIKVPYSMAIPVGVEVTKKDLAIFEEKFDSYSIRSSADIEDGEKNSFAGMFDSYLDVNYKDMIENINKVKGSVNNERLKNYIAINELNDPQMAVVIQSFKEPEFAGVWVGNSDTDGVLEWVEGNGEKLVSGSSNPNTEIWRDGNCNSDTLKVNGIPVGQTLLEYQSKIGSNADFEWMILDGELIMLQFRPVTKKVIVNEDYANDKKDGFQGIPASPGRVEGLARYVDEPNDEIQQDKILLAWLTDPDWLPHLLNSRAAVTAYGGFLCHTAIVCRELGIPCITGIGEDAMEEITKEEEPYLIVDGNAGLINKLEKKNNKGVRP
ncbi:MAG: PEP/pyruvate-binding domain-containing protein [Bacilli bacterium]|nr:PEP/pyruvate-binding domain-containing protein [Bacilli bacterium]MDD4282676.1 PEP/pyruvate-binding domain-containing protein [Bacilli bacterium]